MLIKSEKALEYERMFMRQLTGKHTQNLEGNLKISGAVYYQSRRHDLSIELFLDLCQKYGVIKNDRDIQQIDIRKGLDRENPRTEMIIEHIDDYDEEHPYK